MPNWNDPDSIKRWLDKQPKTVRTERRRPTEDRDERARAEPSNRQPHWEPSAQPQEKPRPESTYKAPAPPEPQHSEKYNQAWRRKNDLPNPQGGYATGMEEITPYTNYQALPEFVTGQRRNPVGGVAGLSELGGMWEGQLEYGTYRPPQTQAQVDASVNLGLGLLSGNQNAIAEYLNSLAESGQPAGGFFLGSALPPVTGRDWGGYGEGEAIKHYQTPTWRKTEDLWRRVRDADIVPVGQTVPLGGQMHPTYGPTPESYYYTGNANVPLDYFLNVPSIYR